MASPKGPRERMDPTRERQIIRLAALVLAGIGLVTLGVLIVAGFFVAALGPLVVTAGAGIWARSMYAELHAEEIARAAQARSVGRIVAQEPPPAQYGPTS